MEDDRHTIEVALLVEARAEVGQADHKASMLLAALGIGFGALLGGFLAGDWDPRSLEGAQALLWWLGAAFAVASIVCSASAVWPRFTVPKQPGQIAYWADVVAYGSKDAFDACQNERFGSFDSRTRSQLWDLSSIVTTKYRLVRAAMVLAALSGSAFLISAVVSVG